MLSNDHTNVKEIGQLYCISHIKSLAWSLFNEGQQNSTHKEILLYSLIKHAVSTHFIGFDFCKVQLYFSRKIRPGYECFLTSDKDKRPYKKPS